MGRRDTPRITGVGLEVIYTGTYPNTCSGFIIAYRDGVEIFKSPPHAFRSTGSAGFKDRISWESYIIEGELEWDEDKDREDFYRWALSQPEGMEIIRAAESALSGARVCCGGCL